MTGQILANRLDSEYIKGRISGTFLTEIRIIEEIRGKLRNLPCKSPWQGKIWVIISTIEKQLKIKKCKINGESVREEGSEGERMRIKRAR